MRRLTGALWRTVGFLLAAICVSMGCVAWQRTEPEQSRVHLICGSGLAMARAEQVYAAESEKEDGIPFAAWRECGDCIVYNAAGDHAVCTDVVELYGSSERILSSGKILHREDVEGCLIGEMLAEQLFGNRGADGLILEYNGRRLTVRGVIREPGMLLVVQAVDADTVFDRITLADQPGITRSRTAQRFVAAYGLDADWLCYEFLGAEYLTERIPGKWSDFAGWRQSFAQMREDAQRTLSTKKFQIDLIYLRDTAEAVALWCVGLFLSAFIIININQAVKKLQRHFLTALSLT